MSGLYQRKRTQNKYMERLLNIDNQFGFNQYNYLFFGLQAMVHQQIEEPVDLSTEFGGPDVGILGKLVVGQPPLPV